MHIFTKTIWKKWQRLSHSTEALLRLETLPKTITMFVQM